MKTFSTLLVLFFLPLAAFSQESVRKLEEPGRHAKYLTPGLLDEWIFDGEKDETIIAYVATTEFDSILGLSVKHGDEEKLLFEVDDPGTDSHFSVRLPEKGQYRIRVHGFQFSECNERRPTRSRMVGRQSPRLLGSTLRNREVIYCQIRKSEPLEHRAPSCGEYNKPFSLFSNLPCDKFEKTC